MEALQLLLSVCYGSGAHGDGVMLSELTSLRWDGTG